MRMLATLLCLIVAPVVHVHYYPEAIVFGTHGGNIGVTLEDNTTQLCSVLRHPDVPYECHDSIPKPTYKEIIW